MSAKKPGASTRKRSSARSKSAVPQKAKQNQQTPEAHAAEATIEAERRLLTALCQRSLPLSTLEQVCVRLGTRKFAHFEHLLIFSALSRIPARTPLQLRELLASRLTLLGFPDIDVTCFLEDRPPAESEIPALLARLS